MSEFTVRTYDNFDSDYQIQIHEKIIKCKMILHKEILKFLIFGNFIISKVYVKLLSILLFFV